MHSELVKSLFMDKIENKAFTFGTTEWFKKETGIQVGTRYQRKKNVKFWWTIVVYCTNQVCNQDYKLKGSIDSLKKGESTVLQIYCKQNSFCRCGKLLDKCLR